MILAARSEIERSMISATAITDARSRNQIGQPAAWTMANNAFPCLFLDAWRRTVRQSNEQRQIPQRSNPSVSPTSKYVAHAQRVVHIAISTKSCG
jgi:hypothetical protein